MGIHEQEDNKGQVNGYAQLDSDGLIPAGLLPAASVLSATTVQLIDAEHAINTSGKSQGLQVFNSTTNTPVWSSGSSPTSTWRTASGAIAHAPS